MTSRLLVLIALLGVAWFMAACHAQESDPTQPAVFEGPSAEIGPGGGILRGDGVELHVPAGALDEVVELSVEPRAPSEATTPLDDLRISPIYVFLPHGQQFDKPVEVRLDLDRPPEGPASVFWLENTLDDPGAATMLSGQVDGGRLVAEVSHFSTGWALEGHPWEAFCGDGVDNDGDGAVDCADTSCRDTTYCLGREPSETLCADGVDNDGNGAVDCEDISCWTPAGCLGWDSEDICDDGVDNDGNGAVDCQDPACSTSTDCRAVTVEHCYNDIDDDNDGDVDCADADCANAEGCIPDFELCDNGVDDDGNGDADCDDEACIWTPTCLDGLPSCNPDEGQVDCNDPLCATAVSCLPQIESCNDSEDNDGDGDVDCDDVDCAGTAVCQTSGEACLNGIDDNGDGIIDCRDLSCASTSACLPIVEICSTLEDNDGDGFGGCDDPDCAGTPLCSYQEELDCSDGIDDDGDGLVDCEDLLDCQWAPACLTEDCTNGIDDDGDGRVDCDDNECDGTNNCGVCQNCAPEQCNGVDDDCDGDIDEYLAGACYTGTPGTNGAGVCGAGSKSCDQGSWTSCRGEVTPGLERCNLIDDDCDGTIDEQCIAPQAVGASAGAGVVRTFDGLMYPLWVAGHYDLAVGRGANAGTLMQIRREPGPTCGSASRTTAFAVTAGSDRVAVHAELPTTSVYQPGPTPELTSNTGGVVYVNGGLWRMDPTSRASIGTDVIVSTDGQRVLLTINSDLEVVITPRSGTLDVMMLSYGTPDFDGLVGPVNGNLSDDLNASGGTTLVDPIAWSEVYNQMAASWESTDTTAFHFETGQTAADFEIADYPPSLFRSVDMSSAARQTTQTNCTNAGVTDPAALEACQLTDRCTGIPASMAAIESLAGASSYASWSSEALVGPDVSGAVVDVIDDSEQLVLGDQLGQIIRTPSIDALANAVLVTQSNLLLAMSDIDHFVGNFVAASGRYIYEIDRFNGQVTSLFDGNGTITALAVDGSDIIFSDLACNCLRRLDTAASTVVNLSGTDSFLNVSQIRAYGAGWLVSDAMGVWYFDGRVQSILITSHPVTGFAPSGGGLVLGLNNGQVLSFSGQQEIDRLSLPVDTLPRSFLANPVGFVVAGEPTGTEPGRIYRVAPDLPPAAACGNGTNELGEECDDGNTTPGDGCDSSCQLEP